MNSQSLSTLQKTNPIFYTKTLKVFKIISLERLAGVLGFHMLDEDKNLNLSINCCFLHHRLKDEEFAHWS